MRPKMTNQSPSEIEKLMIKCWDGDTNQRPTFVEIIKILEKI